ncbi:SPJ_0845 family protein [Liquorilactobacillus cacaonum]|nr:SPJ_0845 family protein [Liquorilactobacillus cacaonum]
MGLTINRQTKLDELFDKFAVDPKQPKKTQKPKKEEDNADKEKEEN